jgi:mitochondrial fission protein ELM1
MGLPFEVKQLEYNGLRRLGPRLLGGSLASLAEASRNSILSKPPPDLTISAGHRSVPIVRAIRRRSGGRTRSVHVGFPRISPGHFDLVIATPQYPLSDHPHLFRVAYALTRAATARPDDANTVRLAMFPQPRRLLLIGGPNLYWKLDERKLLRTLSAMLNEAAERGGSILVTTSARTPRSVQDAVASTLLTSTAPSLLVLPGTTPNYATLLAAADSIRVTADSVAMASDAIWTGKPVALVPVTSSALGRIAKSLNDVLRPGKPLYPQDLRFFWRALAEIGIGETLATPRTSTEDELRAIVGRVRQVLETIR